MSETLYKMEELKFTTDVVSAHVANNDVARDELAMSHALLKKARQAWLGFEARRPL